MIPNRRALAGAVISVFVTPWLMASSAHAADKKPLPTWAAAKPPVNVNGQVKAAAPVVPDVPNLTAAQIVDRHVAARGGVAAWKAVQALQISGKLEAGRGSSDAQMSKMILSGKRMPAKEGTVSVSAPEGTTATDGDKQVELPFKMDLKRPNKTRMEVEFAGKTAIQVFDGSQGWKLRPFLNRTAPEPFTADEAKSEASRAEPEGLLVDYAVKGTTFAREGVDLVDGRPAYRLKVIQKGGKTQHVWIDARSFLDVKVEGAPHRMDGQLRNVYVYQRDFRPVQGVMIPFQLETQIDGYTETHKMLVDKAAVNPKLDDALFAKPRA